MEAQRAEEKQLPVDAKQAIANLLVLKTPCCKIAYGDHFNCDAVYCECGASFCALCRHHFPRNDIPYESRTDYGDNLYHPDSEGRGPHAHVANCPFKRYIYEEGNHFTCDNPRGRKVQRLAYNTYVTNCVRIAAEEGKELISMEALNGDEGAAVQRQIDGDAEMARQMRGEEHEEEV